MGTAERDKPARSGRRSSQMVAQGLTVSHTIGIGSLTSRLLCINEFAVCSRLFCYRIDGGREVAET